MKTKRSLAFLAILFMFTVLNYAGEITYGSAVVQDIVSVYDGDTFFANIKGFPPIVGEKISIRIAGIDTPEIRGTSGYEKKLAEKAKKFLLKKLFKAKEIKLKRMRRDKYFRILADVYVDGVNVAKELIRVGLARRYDGGTKEKW